MLVRDRRWAIASVFASFAILLGLALFTFARIFEIRPLDGDNLYILSWAERAPAAMLFRADPAVYPQWRPFAYLTIWLQHRWLGIDHLGTYFMFNLIVWTACAWTVHRIVDRVAGSRLAGLLAAALVLTDDRSVRAVLWIDERQSSMACLLGLLALLRVVSLGDRPLTRFDWTGVWLLLLASALSKEYGLAFAGALAAWSLSTRRFDVFTAAGGAGVAYAALRLGLAGGAWSRYCENMGYFFAWRTVCLDGPGALPQMAYNVAATAVGTVLNGLLAGSGQIGIARLRLVSSIIWLVPGAIGWLKGSRPARIAALVVLFNALLSLMVYRSRNHVMGLSAWGIVVGAGLAFVNETLRIRALPLIRVAVAALLVFLLAEQTLRTRETMSFEVDSLLRGDPCLRLDSGEMPDLALVRRIKVKYGMTNPDCRDQP